MARPTVGPKGGTGTPPKVKRTKPTKAPPKEETPPQMMTSAPRMAFRQDDRPRLSVVHTVYHQMPGEQPTSHTTRSVQFLSPGSALLNQVVSIGKDWQSLPVRLPEGIASIMLHNLGPDRAPVVLSQDEVEDVQSRVIEVAYSDSDSPHAQWEVLVGHDMRATPLDPSMLKIRCRTGDTRCRIIVAPK